VPFFGEKFFLKEIPGFALFETLLKSEKHL